MLENIIDKFRHELNPGEKLIWVGQPQQGIMLRPGDLFVIPMSIYCVSFTLSWGRDIPSYPPVVGIPFMLLGIPLILMTLYVTVGRFFFDMLKRKKTYYALTSERIIIVTGLLTSNIKNLDFKKLTEINVNAKANGKGTISFGPVNLMDSIGYSFGFLARGYTPTPCFEMIENVQKVYQRIKELQKAGG